MDIFNTLKDLIELESVEYLRPNGQLATQPAIKELGLRLFFSKEREIVLLKYPTKTKVLNVGTMESYTPHPLQKETKNETTISKSKGKAAPTGRSKKNTRTASKSDGK